MAFQRLNIRAKKSFSGLYSFDSPETCPSNRSTAVHLESSPRSDHTQDMEECDLEDFGAKLERCKGKASPGKDSPSKRKKLFGSLRSLRLHSSPTKTKQSMIPRPESPIKHQNVCTTPLPMSPSLALLHFEQSPSDRPMFDLTMHQRSVSGSSLEVHHSSPMTVPGSTKQPTPYNIFPSVTDLPAGTIPDTPGPMQRAFNRDPANYTPCQNASPTPVERYVPSTPVLTPLPGTNLSVGDVDPELVPLPPSVNPSTVHHHGYFDIPVDEQPQMDSTDVLNGLACLKLAGQHCDNQDDPLSGVCTAAHVGRRGTIEEIRHQYEDVKLQDTVKQLEIPQDRVRAHRRTQQVNNLQENVDALDVPKHHQVLPLRPKQADEDLQDRVRTDSCISEDWETCSGGRSTGMVSERALDHRHSNQLCESSASSVYSAAASPEGCKGPDNGNESPPHFGYIVWDSPSGLRRGPAPENLWGRHTGLYDGTGYGPDSSGPSTPREPDHGVADVRLNASSARLSVNGGRSGQNITNGLEDVYHESHEQRNCESLRSIYSAYAYPLGDRVLSSSNNSAGGDIEIPGTREDDIRS